MHKPALTLELPLAPACPLFELFGESDSRGWFCFEGVYLRRAESGRLAIYLNAMRQPALRIASGRVPLFERDVEIVPGLDLLPVGLVELKQFMQSQAPRPDHIGLNVSHAALSERDWLSFIETLAAVFPAYRLAVSSNNDIVMLLCEDWVVELVYDRSSAHSSFHVCLAVAADRATLERRFPSPFGVYKAGDEPFFRSIAFPSWRNFPCYLDLAFSDGAMTPWRNIVEALGRRIDVLDC